MSKRLITGTLRARKGNRYILVTPEGERISVALEGLQVPRIGVDVIGLVDAQDTQPRLRLVENVTRTFLKGRSRIIPSGRPDLTARMLAKLLEGLEPASIHAGTGGMIERTPTFEDEDVAWILAILEPEARRAGVALNVIDPLSLAASPWEDSKLKEEVLPADASTERGALADLKRLLADGLSPTCRRTIETIGRGLAVPSVDFVMPYSPFATGQSWSAEIGGAWRHEFVGMALSGSDARRLSTFREVALAFAPRHLGAVDSGTEAGRQLEQTFADVAAGIALMNFGGSSMSVLRFQRLREAAIARWDGAAPCPIASHAALASLLSSGSVLDTPDAESVLQTAATIARTHAATTAQRLADIRKSADADGVFINLEQVGGNTMEEVVSSYRKDLTECLRHLGGNDRAISRMSRFGVLNVPFGLEDEFDAMVEADPDLAEDDVMDIFSDPITEDLESLLPTPS